MTTTTTDTSAGRLGVVTANVVSLRKEPDGDTELITQAQIGQTIKIEESKENWFYIQMWDTYRGWIPSYGVKILDGQSKPYGSTGIVAVIQDLWVNVYEQASKSSTIVTKATIWAALEVADSEGEWIELHLPSGKIGFIEKTKAKLVNRAHALTIEPPVPGELIKTAKRFVGVPYLWGGTSPFGIDCSGFVQLVHRINGQSLLRDAGIQAGDPRCEPVMRQNVSTGDLVFFSGSQGKDPDIPAITHIGLAIDNDWFIHSGGQGGVQITRFDDPNSRYYHNYWGARRMKFETLEIAGAAKG